MSDIVQVSIRHVYGNRLIYPVNEQAKLFAKIAGSKTLTVAVLDTIKELGYDIQIVQEAL
jgi:hypothetical protein